MQTKEAELPLRLGSLMEQGRDAEQRGDWPRALAAYEAAFGRVAQEGGALELVQLLRWIGQVGRERGDAELAEELYAASVEIARANGLADEVAAGLSAQARLACDGGDTAAAEALYREAREISAGHGDDRSVAAAERSLGALASLRGDVPAALFSYTSALLRYRQIGDLRSATDALHRMGVAHVELGEYDAATTCFDQAYELATAARDLQTLGGVQASRAELYLRRQQYEQARQCCDDSYGIYTQLQSQTGLADAYRFYGALYRETGKAQLADIHLGLALNLAAQAGNALLQAEVHHEKARLYFEEERSLESLGCLNRAHALLCGTGSAGERERRLDELERTYVTVVRRWGAEAIEAKDPYTLGHSERVAEIVVRMAAALGFDDRRRTWMHIGALLHDVGKTVLPAALLAKPGVLNESEWAMMKQHTVVGDDIVAGLELPHDVRPMIRSHHERWDGLGYPDGLRATAIPLDARILAVADVYDALTSTRSYRSAFSPAEARRILAHQAGRALDPEIVGTFESVLNG
jgi:putative nucleotidyltransferase with HDIG domain